MKNLYIILSLLFINGCSFHSNQLDFLKNNFLKSDDLDLKPNWTLLWMDYQHKVYAINNGNNTIFADKKNRVILFDGWQVSNAQGLLKNKIIITKDEDNKLLYKTNNNFISDECSAWQLSGSPETNITQYLQICNNISNDDEYENQIVLSNNEIVALSFRIHPEYPNLILKMNLHSQLEL